MRIGHRVDVGTGIVLAVTAGVTLVLGIVPAVFVDWAQDATAADDTSSACDAGRGERIAAEWLARTTHREP